MRAFSLVSLLTFCSYVGLIDALELDEKASCKFIQTTSRLSSALTWFSSETVAGKNVHFLSYNRERYLGNEPYSVELFVDDESSLQKGGFDAKKPTKIFIHGFKANANKTACVVVRDGFLKSGDFNVIVIDWSANQHGVFNILLEYDKVVARLPAVADHIGKFLRFLEKQGVDLSTTTIVGHSLGAHVAGLASQTVGKKIGRIVGLDPAGVGFYEKSADERLSKDDAKQVEIIHSDMDECGLKTQIGHYDFYPNGGSVQPGCPSHLCFHARSYRYLAESLDANLKGFYGRLCADWWSMQKGNCSGEALLMGGLDAKSAAHGIYYLTTDDKAPYALGRL